MRRILVVEDVSALRDTIVRLLTRFGVQSWIAATGTQALSICRAEKDSLSLVLLDLGLPEIGGQQVWETLHAEGFAVPVVIMSGDDDEITPPPAGYLRKPFTSQSLQVALEKYARPTG